MTQAAVESRPRKSLEWHRYAACRGMETNAFYLADGERAKRARRREAAAKAVCETCPVLAECLEWALDSEERWGVWGGLTPEERSGLFLRPAG